MHNALTICKKMKIEKKEKLIFNFFLIFYLVLGIQLTFNYNFINTMNLLFDADTARVINDISTILINHYRLSVHPLFVIIMQPIYFIIKGITQNKMLALVIISSIVSALSVAIVYKIISLYCNKEKINILLSMCYGFTFASFMFTGGIEVYNISALALLFLWYFIAKKLKGEWKKGDLFILSFLGLLSLSIVITNYVVFLIGCLVLLISKKVDFKDLFCINIIICISFLIISNLQNFIWQNTPTIINPLNSASQEKVYMDFSLDLNKLKNVINDTCINSIISSNVKLNEKDKIITFENIPLWNLVIVSLFLIFTLIYTLKNFKNNKYINIGLILTFLFNFILHCIYGNTCCFLYSLHFLYLIFLLFGINYKSENKINIKASISFLIIMLISEIIINNKEFLNVIQIVSKLLEKNYFAEKFNIYFLIIISVIVIIFVLAILNLFIRYVKKAKSSKDSTNKWQYFISAALCFIVIESVFVEIETIPHYKKIFGINLESNYSLNEEVVEKYADIKDISVSENYSDFINNYTVEVDSYLEYVKEYKNFINEHNCTIYDGLPNIDFYLFGMGNRRKILFKDNKLIDVDDGRIIKQFNMSKYLIIPNEYTVLIKENDGKYIKIYENNQGVYIQSNGENDTIDGTEIDINLYTFDKQKYKELKKVLYSEILFNIKDGKLNPNVISYNEPFYRDAAMACMVLKQTNNTDLISKWISSIDKVYDGQNANENDTDNLGELLYMISTQENKNVDLINKIEQEAEKIANSNPNGYYLYGKTDFSSQYKYQNIWYEFGLKSLGKECKFNYKDLNDMYSNLTWWNNKDSQIPINANENYPYIGWANYHTSNKKGKLIVNSKLYPLSWEKDASEANYDKIRIIDENYSKEKISPTHIWSASEMILLILDETGDLL